jgi:ferredoxin-nitrite reductase
MALAEASGAVSSGEFTLEQKAYLHGFFTAVARNHPYVGKLSSGLLTNDATAGGPNLATEPEFFGTPVSDLCAEEVWKYEANPLDVWDQLLAHAAEDKAPDAEHRFRSSSMASFT